MRRFKIIRELDPILPPAPSITAEGVEFDNGRVCICWNPKVTTMILFDSMHDMELLMADSKTSRVEYIDD